MGSLPSSSPTYHDVVVVGGALLQGLEQLVDGGVGEPHHGGRGRQRVLEGRGTLLPCAHGKEEPTGQPSPPQAAHLNAEVLVPLAQHSIHILQDQIRSLLQQVVVEVEAQQLGSIHFLQTKRDSVSLGQRTRSKPQEQATSMGGAFLKLASPSGGACLGAFFLAQATTRAMPGGDARPVLTL